jgi:hypothetical protein
MGCVVTASRPRASIFLQNSALTPSQQPGYIERHLSEFIPIFLISDRIPKDFSGRGFSPARMFFDNSDSVRELKLISI